ncbi:MAG: hypothetical protein KDC87_08550 [Planctomycetes bacterium]|nr:hypothetical protein [Planctomycetota bacterium]
MSGHGERVSQGRERNQRSGLLPSRATTKENIQHIARVVEVDIGDGRWLVAQSPRYFDFLGKMAAQANRLGRVGRYVRTGPATRGGLQRRGNQASAADIGNHVVLAVLTRQADGTFLVERSACIGALSGW